MTQPLDMTRVERARELLEKGARTQHGPGGMIRLVLDGMVVMMTSPAVVMAARPGQPVLPGTGTC